MPCLQTKVAAGAEPGAAGPSGPPSAEPSVHPDYDLTESRSGELGLRERVKVLLAAVGGTRATDDQQTGVGGPAQGPIFVDLFDARRHLDDALAFANPEVSGSGGGPANSHP